MSTLHRISVAARKLGIHVKRWPSDNPAYGSYRALIRKNPQWIIDVGANEGQFAREMREFGYRGNIHSIEPGSAAFALLSSRSARDPGWTCERSAVGDSRRVAKLNLAGNQGQSSSVLEMLQAHVEADPTSAYTGKIETVQMTTLSEVLNRLGVETNQVAIKLDVQGYEEKALEGLGDLLTEVQALQLELSIEPLYEDAWSFDASLLWMRDRGFRLTYISPGFTDQEGSMLQCDAVFLR